MTTKGIVVQSGTPPRRIDIITSLTGLEFDAAWHRRVTCRSDGDEIPFLGRDDLIVNKRATARPKDLADLDVLERGDRHL
ncbi:MAG: hypothetical protein KBD01_07965 [Acidobacteria bacterium]|nr:hypothetical protein [Acidobacteriota bacterium]